MYKIQDLKKYDYFKDIDINYALDSLTGVLTRTNILGFANYLVENNVEFMMGILDIDNFKLVNDNYGHKIGDGCLQQIGEGLANYVGNEGLVGRFGGDEFIVIWLKGTSYDDVHAYLDKMYTKADIIRKKVTVMNVSFYVTATIGCASFPKDAKTYDELFLTVDKALYRGKTKGRNCYIIYVENKHKNIEVNLREQYTLTNMFLRISEIADNKIISKDDKIKNIMDFISSALQVSEAATLFKDKRAIFSGDGYDCEIDEECLKIFEDLTKDNPIFVYSCFYKSTNQKLLNFVKEKHIVTFIVSKIIVSNEIFGYIVLFEDKITRIWQERESALLLYLNRIVELLYK